MKRLLTLLVFALSVLAVPAAAEDGPVKAAFFYKVKWGSQSEFEALFFKNYYPVLQAQAKDGRRVKAFEIYRPTHHGDGRADWTFMLVMTYVSLQASVAPSGDDVVIRRLFPDQDTYKREEARRFGLLDAHWDVPLTGVTHEKKP